MHLVTTIHFIMDAKMPKTVMDIGKHGWTSLRLDGAPLEWREVEELVQESYRLVMPKRLQRALHAEPERTRRK